MFILKQHFLANLKDISVFNKMFATLRSKLLKSITKASLNKCYMKSEKDWLWWGLFEGGLIFMSMSRVGAYLRQVGLLKA